MAVQVPFYVPYARVMTLPKEIILMPAIAQLMPGIMEEHAHGKNKIKNLYLHFNLNIISATACTGCNGDDRSYRDAAYSMRYLYINSLE
jgi:hypothetical protein